MMHRTLGPIVIALACTGLLPTADAQAQTAAPPSSSQPSKTKVVRRPVVDLKKQAQAERPGQVMPGQPPLPPAPRPTAVPPPNESSAPTVVAPPVPQALPDPIVPIAPAAQSPPATAEPAPGVDLVDVPPPPPTRTPAARVAKPLKPAPIPVSADSTRGPEAKPATPPGAEPSTPPVEAPHVPTEPPDEMVPLETVPIPEPLAATAEKPKAIGEPIDAQITMLEGPPDVVQWRTDDGTWEGPAIGGRAKGVIEVRTGLGASTTLTLADQVSVKISRLSRVKFEQRSPAKDGMPVELVVELSRGEVDIKPLPLTPGGPAPAVVRVITPDKNFTTRLATGIRFDAFSGTRLRVLGGEK